MSNPRDASTPTAGGARSTVVGSLAALIGYYLASQGASGEVVASTTAVATGVLGYIGKLVRTYYPDLPTPI